jgi:hypothetical protein
MPVQISREKSLLRRDAKRRAAIYHERAAALAKAALRVRSDDDRRHFLSLSRTFERTAEALQRELSD